LHVHAQEKTGTIPQKIGETLSVDVNLVTVPFTINDESGRSGAHLPRDAFNITKMTHFKPSSGSPLKRAV
jgi:hypothetical protein